MNKDLRDILAAVASRAPARALVTVVGTEGSSYRRPGARLLVGDGGRLAGSVSGGCLERSLTQRAVWLAEDGPRLVRLSTAAEPDETELQYPGCGGTIELLVERVCAADADGPLALLQWIAEQRVPAGLVTVTRSEAEEIGVGARLARAGDRQRAAGAGDRLLALCGRDLVAGSVGPRTYRLGGARIDVVFERIEPARELLVVGRHHDVAAVVELARLLGWCTTVAASGTPARELGRPDHRIELSAAEVLDWAASRAGAAVVVMTHSLALDREVLARLLPRAANLAYVGLLGPRHRAREILDQIQVGAAADRLHAPVGLDLGGDGPEAVALSIVAHIQTTWSERVERAAAPMLSRLG